jgi:hypothetical protein
MRVLVGCEESGKVRDAFLKRGFDAWSNDFEPARNGGPHLQKCVKRAIIEDGPWDIIILHYSCTMTAVSGNRWYGEGTPGHIERLIDIAWAVDLWELAKEHAIIGCMYENPSSVIWSHIGKPHYIQPWQFGHKEVKKTGLLSYNLPDIEPTNIVGPPPPSGTEERKKWERVWRMAKSDTRKRDRSETYQGVADAIAQQIGDYAILKRMLI